MCVLTIPEETLDLAQITQSEIRDLQILDLLILDLQIPAILILVQIVLPAAELIQLRLEALNRAPLEALVEAAPDLAEAAVEVDEAEEDKIISLYND
jgi:hypothetical protein